MDSNERDEKYMVSFGDCVIFRILRGGHRQQCFRRNEKLPTIRHGRQGITFYDKLQLWYSEVSNVGIDRVPCSAFIFCKSMCHDGSRFIMTPQFTFVFSCARMKIYLAPEFIIAIIHCEDFAPAMREASSKGNSIVIGLTCVCRIHYASCLTDLTRYRAISILMKSRLS